MEDNRNELPTDTVQFRIEEHLRMIRQHIAVISVPFYIAIGLFGLGVVLAIGMAIVGFGDG